MGEVKDTNNSPPTPRKKNLWNDQVNAAYSRVSTYIYIFIITFLSINIYRVASTYNILIEMNLHGSYLGGETYTGHKANHIYWLVRHKSYTPLIFIWSLRKLFLNVLKSFFFCVESIIRQADIKKREYQLTRGSS